MLLFVISWIWLKFIKSAIKIKGYFFEKCAFWYLSFNLINLMELFYNFNYFFIFYEIYRELVLLFQNSEEILIVFLFKRISNRRNFFCIKFILFFYFFYKSFINNFFGLVLGWNFLVKYFPDLWVELLSTTGNLNCFFKVLSVPSLMYLSLDSGNLQKELWFSSSSNAIQNLGILCFPNQFHASCFCAHVVQFC